MVNIRKSPPKEIRHVVAVNELIMRLSKWRRNAQSARLKSQLEVQMYNIYLKWGNLESFLTYFFNYGEDYHVCGGQIKTPPKKKITGGSL